MTPPTLLVLAAGMGSRYGGLKQIDPVGPGGEAILDYSVFDALRAGFGKVVFVIRRDMADAFRQAIGSRFEKRVPVEFVFQELDKLPPGFTPPPGRQKPWGTAHAVLMAAELALAAWDRTGRKLWSRFVEPPWSFLVVDDKVHLDVMGKHTEFSLLG